MATITRGCLDAPSLAAYMKGVVEEWEFMESIAYTEEGRILTASHVKLMKNLIQQIELGKWDSVEVGNYE